MRRCPRTFPAAVLAVLGLVAAAGPAAAFGPGETFLTGGLDLPPGALAGGQSGAAMDAPQRASASSDGRWVAFVSDADTLDAAAHPDVTNVYRKDRLTGEVVLVSRGDGAAGAAAAVSSELPSISADGRYVAFRTGAAFAAADRDGGTADVYVRDVRVGTTTLATASTADVVQTSSSVGGFALSGDGRFVVFATEDQLVGADTDAHWDVYRRNTATGRTDVVSIATGGRTGNGASIDPSVSDDGTWVAFSSQARDLLLGYTAGAGYQVFARDMTAGRTSLVSARASSASTGSNGESTESEIAGAPATGRADRVAIAYSSYASDIDAADPSGQSSVFRRLLSSARSTLVSRADVGAGDANADSRAHTPSISDDGLLVAFASDATNLGAGADYYGVYVHAIADASTGRGRTLLGSAHNSYAVQPAFSGDGGFLTWVESGATADSDPDLYGVFGRSFDAATAALGAVQLVSRPPGTAPFLATWIAVGEPDSGKRVVSADGRYVAFAAYTSRLPGSGALGATQVYRRDLRTGAIELVSRTTGAEGAPADVYSYQPSVSADGTRVAFLTGAHLDAAHPGPTFQAYVRDLAAGTTTLVSRADGAGGAPPNEDVLYPAISPDGARVAFATTATNMGAAGTDQHVYLRDLAAGTTLLVDRANGAAGAPGDDNAELPSLSWDGRWIAFASQAGNLDADDPDSFSDVFLRDTVQRTTTLLSRRGGLAGQHASGVSYDPSISADGSVVAFQASDQTLAPEAGAWGGKTQIVARTVATGANALVSRAPAGAPANDHATHASVSGNGGVVAFESDATNLLAGVGGPSHPGVFARTTATGTLSGPPAFGLVGTELQNRAQHPAISDDGQCLAFDASGHNAATGTAGDGYTTYMYVASGECPKPEPVAPIARRAARPRLSSASLSHKRFRVGRRATARAAARRRARRAPVGTTFRFTLNARANVAIAFERQAPGRLVGRFCRRPARRLRRHLRCVRFVSAGRIARGGLAAGRSRIAFSGRIGRRALKPGAYRARLRASNAGGASAWVRLRFSVVK